MPLYMVNVLPCKDFNRIYKIHEIFYINVRNAIVVKELDMPAKFLISSLSAWNVLRNTSLQIAILKSRIICTCANCDAYHPASFKGCPKNPLNINNIFAPNNETNNKNSNSITKQPTNAISKNVLDFIEIL